MFLVRKGPFGKMWQKEEDEEEEEEEEEEEQEEEEQLNLVLSSTD